MILCIILQLLSLWIQCGNSIIITCNYYFFIIKFQCCVIHHNVLTHFFFCIIYLFHIHCIIGLYTYIAAWFYRFGCYTLYSKTESPVSNICLVLTAIDFWLFFLTCFFISFWLYILHDIHLLIQNWKEPQNYIINTYNI